MNVLLFAFLAVSASLVSCKLPELTDSAIEDFATSLSNDTETNGALKYLLQIALETRQNSAKCTARASSETDQSYCKVATDKILDVIVEVKYIARTVNTIFTELREQQNFAIPTNSYVITPSGPSSNGNGNGNGNGNNGNNGNNQGRPNQETVNNGQTGQTHWGYVTGFRQ